MTATIMSSVLKAIITQNPSDQQNELDGFESHRIFINEKTQRIYLLGYDLRGTIYAIYSFAEEILGVPPLKYWSSWSPVIKENIIIPAV